MINLYSHNSHINNTLHRAILQDIVEINLGLDYGSTNDKTDEELSGLYTLVSIVSITTNSAKATLINRVKVMSEGQAGNILLEEKIKYNK